MPVAKEIEEVLRDLPRVYEWASSSSEVEKLSELLRKHERVYLVGCGSSNHLLLTLSKYITARLSSFVKVIPAGEILLAYEYSVPQKYQGLAIFLSRSGETTETVEAMRIMKGKGFETVGVTLEGKSTLSLEADLSITPPIREDSIVMTKSFCAILMTLQMAVDASAGNPRKDVYEEILSRLKDLYEDAREDARNFADGSRYVFLGIGPYEGIAKESALKLEEMSLTTVEAMSTLEYRHGPKALVEKGVYITIFGDGEEEEKLKEELEGYGGKVLLRRRVAEDYVDSFVQVIFAHHLGMFIAQKKNIDVEAPRHLTKVVRI